MKRFPKKSSIESAEAGGVAESATRGDSRSERWRVAAVAALLVLSVCAIYAQTRHYKFVDYDDNGYIYDNQHVLDGLTWRGLVWDFTTFSQTNWHPLTWLSHQLDCQIYGSWAGGAHQTNFLLHAANAVLVFLIFYAMTGALWRCAFLAAFFALHPLRVESVAWAAERKDVLSSLFWLLALAAYVRYARQPGRMRLTLVALTLAIGLLAKPTLVTFPFTLLLLDYWPLGRCTFGPPPARPGAIAAPVSWKRLIGEKTPLFILAVASSQITMLAQQKAMTPVPFLVRLINAARAYLLYLSNTIVPRNLAVIYSFSPPTEKDLLPLAALSVILLIPLTVLILRFARRVPHLAMGWLWYLGTLVPMIGLVYVGLQSRADRYTYIPSIGLGVMAAWGGWALAERLRLKRRTVAASAVVVCAIWSALAWHQTTYWRDSTTLFEHTLQATGEENEVALQVLAKVMMDNNRPQDAMRCYQILWRFYSDSSSIAGAGQGTNAVDLSPKAQRKYRREPKILAVLLTEMSQAAVALGHDNESMNLCREALVLNPANGIAHCNLGVGYFKQGRSEDAFKEFLQAVKYDPGFELAQMNLGWAYYVRHKDAEALKCFAAALKINGKDIDALSGMGSVYLRQGRFDEAVEKFKDALVLNPGDPDIQKQLQKARQGKA